MSESGKSKRRFWQIHLSTAMVLVVVASWLLYAAIYFTSKALKDMDLNQYWFNPENARMYIIGSLAFLVCIGAFLEWLIRRREGRKL